MDKIFNKIKEERGVLLMQVLVVAGITVILLALSLPYIQEYKPNLELNATARELTSDLRYAQQLTVTEQIPHVVEMNLIGDSYQVLKVGEETTIVKTYFFDEGINFQQITGLTDNKVRFNFYGGVSESGQVVLVNSKSKTATINIKPSGYVQLAN